MSFASIEFVGLFLPAVVIVYFAAQRYAGATVARLWLIVASVVFYCTADMKYLPVVAGSLLFNFLVARGITRTAESQRRRYLMFGISVNVLLLVFFKYTAFAIENIDDLTGLNIPVPRLGFPLGISFFTLQQIMFLVDCYERMAVPFRVIDHALFLTFFPYITSGPLVHAKEMRLTLESQEARRPNYDNFAAGIYVFALGLFKKAVIADSFGLIASTGFDFDGRLSLTEAWLSSLSFTFQLYFDFSGYSDMAVGAALMLNFKLPQNFNSPLKSTSIIEFWQRWHITLSNFITTYLYTPMLRALAKITFAKAMVITLISMAIAGLWHGASWTYVAFGTLHGVGLVANQIWKKKKRKLPKALAWLLTFAFVNFTFVFFRAASLQHAGSILYAMMVPSHSNSGAFEVFRPVERLQLLLIVLTGLVFCFYFENSGQKMLKFVPSKRSMAVAVSAVLVALLFLNGVSSRGFVYRDF